MELFEEELHKRPEMPDYSSVKVWTEIHRIMGFLRFNPDDDGVYVARCAPDHFILPVLSAHFRRRFGKTSWVIIDEKRGLSLRCENGGRPQLSPFSESLSPTRAAENERDPKDPRNPKDPWEELWQLYHRSINNEARKNLRLQQQLIPNRYRKYLPEISEQ